MLLTNNNACAKFLKLWYVVHFNRAKISKISKVENLVYFSDFKMSQKRFAVEKCSGQTIKGQST